MTGKVIKVFGRYYTVKSEEGREINCILRGIIRKDKRLRRFSDPAATGDIVDFEINDDGEGVINSILDRDNIFSRKERGNSKEDIIASNLDQVAVIQSFKIPKPNLRFVDRLIVRGEKENIPVILCVNKLDLAEKKDISYFISYYKNAGIEVIFTSALNGKGLNKLKEIIRGKTTLLAGSSGVGKSTIINSIYPGHNIKTTEVSESTGKGKHTTTNVIMHTMADGTEIIDTPGLREFGLVDIELHFLKNYFMEFKMYNDNCSFRSCTHDHEPGCEIKNQVDSGNICYDRYVSYLQILHSLKDHYDSMY